MEKSDLDILLERYVRGELTEAEREKVEAWLDAIGREDEPLDDLTAEEEDRIFARLRSTSPDLEAELSKSPRPGRFWFLGVAATVVLLLAVSFFLWRNSDFKDPEGGLVEKVILNDGSLVWLRGPSQIAYYEKPDENVRYATLEGDALFEVTKNPAQPFVVQCGDVRVRVVGTSFNIRMTGDLVEVTVLTGRVKLSSLSDTLGIELSAKEKGVYDGKGLFGKLNAPSEELSSLKAATGYDMEFANAPAKHVFEQLQQKFNVSFEFSQSDVQQCRLTIDLTDKSLNDSMRLIAEILNFTFSIEADMVRVTGGGCSQP